MKKGFKKIIITFLIFIVFIMLLFVFAYIKKQMKILKNYNINEKLVVNFVGIEGKKFLLDLNTGEFEIYLGTYNFIDNNYLDSELIGKTIKSPINDYYLKETGVYIDNKVIYESNTPSYSKYWTLDGLYLISNEGYILSSLFGIRDALITPTIIELSTGKIIQIKLKDEKGNFFTIEKILGYVLN